MLGVYIVFAVFVVAFCIMVLSKLNTYKKLDEKN